MEANISSQIAPMPGFSPQHPLGLWEKAYGRAAPHGMPCGMLVSLPCLSASRESLRRPQTLPLRRAPPLRAPMPHCSMNFCRQDTCALGSGGPLP